MFEVRQLPRCTSPANRNNNIGRDRETHSVDPAKRKKRCRCLALAKNETPAGDRMRLLWHWRRLALALVLPSKKCAGVGRPLEWESPLSVVLGGGRQVRLGYGLWPFYYD